MPGEHPQFTDTQLAALRKEWDVLRTVDPDSNAWKKVERQVKSWPDYMLVQLATVKPSIRFLSYLARRTYNERHPGAPLVLVTGPEGDVTLAVPARAGA